MWRDIAIDLLLAAAWFLAVYLIVRLAVTGGAQPLTGLAAGLLLAVAVHGARHERCRG